MCWEDEEGGGRWKEEVVDGGEGEEAGLERESGVGVEEEEEEEEEEEREAESGVAEVTEAGVGVCWREASMCV